MVDSKFKDAKNYNFLTDLDLGIFLDAKDTVNHWCVAQICDIDNERN